MPRKFLTLISLLALFLLTPRAHARPRARCWVEPGQEQSGEGREKRQARIRRALGLEASRSNEELYEGLHLGLARLEALGNGSAPLPQARVQAPPEAL